jgi:predicted nuclease with RNAse H fold
MMMEGLAQEATMPWESLREVSAQEENDVVLTRDVLARMEVVAVDAPLGTNGVRVDEARPRPDDATGDNASAPEPLGGAV